jgi:hypothetical protein
MYFTLKNFPAFFRISWGMTCRFCEGLFGAIFEHRELWKRSVNSVVWKWRWGTYRGWFGWPLATLGNVFEQGEFVLLVVMRSLIVSRVSHDISFCVWSWNFGNIAANLTQDVHDFAIEPNLCGHWCFSLNFLYGHLQSTFGSYCVVYLYATKCEQ